MPYFVKHYVKQLFVACLFALTAYTEVRVCAAASEVEMALKSKKRAPASSAARVVPIRPLAPKVAPAAYRDPVELLRSIAPGQVAVAYGLPGSGKTTIVEKALDKGVRNFDRIWVYDPFARRDRANWANGDRSRKPWWPRQPVVTVDQLLRQIASGQLSMLDSPRCKVVVAGPDNGTFDTRILALHFGRLVTLLEKTHARSGLRSLLVAEEFGRYGREAVEAVHLVASGGAHVGLGFVGITQRWGRIQKDAREAVTLAVAGAIGGDDDYDATVKEFGRAFGDRVRALTPPDENGRPTSNPVAIRRGDKEQV